MLYLARVFVPDPFLAAVTPKGTLGVINRLEYGRVRQRSAFDAVRLLESERERVGGALGLPPKQVGPVELIRSLAEEFGCGTVEVPADFPALHYQGLLESGLEVSVVEGAMFPARTLKTDAEARAIRKGNAASAAGIRAAEAVLRRSKISGGKLYFEGAVLSSERLRQIIDRTCLERGAVARHTIVAGGRQACDPHESGHGPLRPGELIIIDVFPRLQDSGYHGDLTRTFLKGRASEAQRALVAAVREAQKSALGRLKPGVTGGGVHAAAAAVFRRRGFLTERREAGFAGFIHSTGHGLGLDVHEPPRLGPGAGKLRRGEVVTVEPGLYYPELGGCRIEDVVRLVPGGCEKLSNLHYHWEIR